MNLFRLAALGLLLSLAAYAVTRFILFDLVTSQLNAASRQNTAGKRVLITGSSRGIGEALARVYAQAGAKVVVHARRRQSLELIMQKCRDLGAGSCHAVEGDMSQPAAAAQVVQRAADAMGGLDIVIVNHISPSPFTPLSRAVAGMLDGATQRAMQTNLFSYAQAASAALPHLQKSAGSLILVSSVAAKLPIPYCYEYCFSKRAVQALFSSLRQELAMNGSAVHLGIATLGLIDTEAAQVTVRQQYKQEMHFASRDATARDIASMPVARVREIISPWPIRALLLMRDLLPEQFEFGLRYIVKKQ